MLTSRYRKAEKADVTSGDAALARAAPASLPSRVLASFLILGCGVFAVVYFMTRSMAAFDGRPGASIVAAMAVAGVLFSLSAYSIVGHHRDLRNAGRRLSEPEPVEVLEVRASRVADVEAPGSTGPALCFELADGQLLLLRGQWLLEPSLYRAPVPDGDDGRDDRFNALDDPYAFPSDHFSLHRWRGGEGAVDARPFWIQVHGRYLPPEQSTARLPRAGKVGDVKVFPGSIGTLQADIDRAFA
jgi:hypothetical protein